MARILLRQTYNGHAAGEIIEIDGGRAAILIQDRVGVLAPPKPPSTTIDKLKEILTQFRVGLDSLDFAPEEEAESKALLQAAIVPILPAFMPTMSAEEFNAAQAQGGTPAPTPQAKPKANPSGKKNQGK